RGPPGPHPASHRLPQRAAGPPGAAVSPLAAIAATVALLAGNAFFVIAEFALVTARRPRLERAAARGSRAARAAAAASAELPLMLAGAQLGVTMCSLGLGAVTEPAVEHLLAPPLHAIGAPEAAAEAVALAVALAAVTFRSEERRV